MKSLHLPPKPPKRPWLIDILCQYQTGQCTATQVASLHRVVALGYCCFAQSLDTLPKPTRANRQLGSKGDFAASGKWIIEKKKISKHYFCHNGIYTLWYMFFPDDSQLKTGANVVRSVQSWVCRPRDCPIKPTIFAKHITGVKACIAMHPINNVISIV